MSSDTESRQTTTDSPTQSSHTHRSSHTQDIPQDDGSQSNQKLDSARTTAARRRFLQLLGTGGVLSMAGCSNSTGKAAKGQVSYQDHPKGNQQCSNCRFYRTAENGDATGTCTRVKGEIAPDAWCNVYSKG
ncbi:high-potential iron-sulfur protein [Haladaptatus pallidirubidus]|uniref:high-potential iron-sulfur protein n=2 Tax=Haladaptatus pallidirubidus TaxID=1008152 RepID=UPI0031EF3ADD